MKYLITIIFAFFLCFEASAQVDDRDFKIVPIQDSLIAREGKKQSIASRVFGSITDKSKRTLLALGDPFPNQIVTLIINPANKKKFPATLYQNTDLMVTGIVEVHNGKLEMQLSDPSQIGLVVRTIRNY